ANLEKELSLGVENTILLFCKYRSEVEEYTKKYSQKYSLLSCVGGETKDFSLSLANSEAAPKLIIATTCLSHGVNLPLIARIYFTYLVEDLDFYTQMVGRGGRKGEVFEVHCLEKEAFSFRSFFRL